MSEGDSQDMLSHAKTAGRNVVEWTRMERSWHFIFNQVILKMQQLWQDTKKIWHLMQLEV